MRWEEEAPPEKRAGWPRKVATPYAELTDQEQESDRIEARKTITLLLGWLARGEYKRAAGEGK